MPRALGVLKCLVASAICCSLLKTSACEYDGHYSAICRSLNTTGIPSVASRAIKLLEISGNHIDTLEDDCFLEFPNLTRLFLHGNAISRVEGGAFRGLEELRVLDLSRNKITSISNTIFQNNHKLVKLCLKGNPIDLSSPTPFILSTTITNLDLRECNLTTLNDVTFKGLSNLETLNLVRNSLHRIPVTFFKSLRKLKAIYLEGNPWRCDDVAELFISKRDVIGDYKKIRCVSSDGQQHELSISTVTSSQQVVDTSGSSQQVVETSGSSRQVVETSGSSQQVVDTSGSSQQVLETSGSTAADFSRAVTTQLTQIPVHREGHDISNKAPKQHTIKSDKNDLGDINDHKDFTSTSTTVGRGRRGFGEDLLSDAIIYLNLAVVVLIFGAAVFVVVLYTSTISSCEKNPRLEEEPTEAMIEQSSLVDCGNVM